jgi:sugar phosphate permease
MLKARNANVAACEGAAMTETQNENERLENIYRRISRRILPVLFLAYIIAIIDRINIGFAQIAMKSDLGFTDAIFGLGAGIFFIGFVLFEVPSNLVLSRSGGRKTFMRIMVGWGLASTAMALVRTPGMLFFIRFLIGAFEAGFLPGVVLYLAYWFPASRRARAVGALFVAANFSGAAGALTAGIVLQFMDGSLGLFGWQWLFIVEGVPAVILGVVAWNLLVDKPADAHWLTSDEKALHAIDLQRADEAESGANSHSFLSVLKDPKVMILVAVYFTLNCAATVISFWMPIMINSAGAAGMLRTGLLSAFPFVAGMFGILVITRHSDLTRERIFHCAVGIASAAIALGVLPRFAGNLPVVLALLSVAVVGTFSAFPVFWSIPQQYLSRSTAAAGLALISSLGQLGGFLSPVAIGWIKNETGKLDSALYALAVVMILGAGLLVVGLRRGRITGEVRTVSAARDVDVLAA